MGVGDEFSFFYTFFNLDWNWFLIHFTENNGMAFGWEVPGLYGKPLLTLFRIIVVAVGLFYIKSIIKPSLPTGGLIALGLIIGGAIGNIIDSTFYGLLFSESYKEIGYPPLLLYDGAPPYLLSGRVVDMFHFPLFNVVIPHWIPFFGGYFEFFRPVFNIADAGISVGIFTILLFYRKEFN